MSMKNHLLGLYEKALNPAESWSEHLRKAKAIGFDFLEISIDESEVRLARLDWTREEMAALRQSCFEAEIGFQSMCLSAHRRFPFGSADPSVRDKAYEIMQKAIDFAVFMGIRVIQLAGYDVYYEPSTPDSVRRFQEGINWAVKQAAQKQVMLAMEIMDTSFLNSISKHMAYEAMLHSPWYKVYPDVGNISAWPENNVDLEFAQGVSSIVAVHLKDTLAVTNKFAGKFKGVPFGTGCVDFPKRFGQLEQLGYTGPYMIEMWYEEGSDDMEQIRHAKTWLEQQFEIGTETQDAVLHRT